MELLSLTPRLEERGKRLRLRNPQLGDFTVDPRGERALTVEHDRVAWIDLKTGKASKRHAIKDARKVALSPDGRVAAVTTVTGFRIGRSDDLSRGRTPEMRYVSGRAAFSADGKRVALATWEGGEVWDLAAMLPG